MATTLLVPPAPAPLLAPQMGPTGPATGIGGPAASLPSQSPVHDYVRANPQATADDLSQKFGLPPLVAQGVISDVRGPLQPAMAAPDPTSLAQAFSPLVPPKPAAAMPAPLANALAPASVPSPAPAQTQFPAAVMAAPQSAAVAPTMNPAPIVPPVSPTVSPMAAPPTQTPTGWPVDMQNRLALQNNAGTQPNGTFPTDSAPSIAPGAQPAPLVAPKGPSRLQQIAPLILAGILGSRNPQSGASLLGGWQAGEAQNRAEQMQKNALAQEQQQQQFENNLKVQGEIDTRRFHEDEIADAKAKIASEEKIAADKAASDAAKEAAKQSSADAIVKAIRGAQDGESAREVVKSIDPSDKSGFVAALSNPDGSAKQFNPWYSQAEKARHDAATEATSDKRVGVAQGSLAERTRHDKVAEGQGSTRLTIDQARQKEQTAHDQAMELIGNKNATSNWIRANTGQKAQDDLANYRAWQENGGKQADQTSKSVYSSPWGATYDKAVNERDAASKALAEWRAKTDPATGDLLNKGKPDPAELVDRITRLDAQIQHMNNVTPDKLAPRSQNWRAGQGGQTTSSVKVLANPVGDSIDRAARQIQASGACSGGHNCQEIARKTIQKVSPEYNQYFAGSAKSTLGNFQRAGLAQPYDPSQSIPAGSLLYSATMGKGNGHVQIVGSDGTRYDQYGKNKFSPSEFQYFVPPPGGRAVASPRIASAPTGTLAPEQIKSMSTGDLLKRLASKYAK